MDIRDEPAERSVEASLKATYRALLARGLQAGEAANLTAFLHGLPSGDFQWTLAEIEAIVRRRLTHAADQRAEQAAFLAARARASGIRLGTEARGGHASARSGRRRTHVIDPPGP